MIQKKITTKELATNQLHSQTGLWFGREMLALDAGQNPAVLFRSPDGSIGAILSLNEHANDSKQIASKLFLDALEKFKSKRIDVSSLEVAIVGGADNAKWKFNNLAHELKSASIVFKKIDTNGNDYLKIYFEPKSGFVHLFKEKANPDDWNPAVAKLTIESGTKGFSEGYAGGVVANATRFFREKHTFTALRELVIPAHLRLTPDEPFLIWSAASSKGAEAYSYAMYIDRLLKRAKANCSFKVYGTDINSKLVEEAKIGEYKLNKHDLDSYSRYFEEYGKLSDDKVMFGDEIRNHISFNCFDLKNVSRIRNFRMIVCANVFQYYDDSARNHFLKNFISVLQKPGYLFVGPLRRDVSESLSLTALLEYKMFMVE